MANLKYTHANDYTYSGHTGKWIQIHAVTKPEYNKIKQNQGFSFDDRVWQGDLLEYIKSLTFFRPLPNLTYTTGMVYSCAKDEYGGTKH